MPRRSRVHLNGVSLHIVQRCHNREPCFFCEDDYTSYLYWLGKAQDETGCALHAYVLMTNHVHLLLTPRKAATVPRLIISLGRRNVQYINRIYRRTGTLWDSRYKSSNVQAEPWRIGRCSGRNWTAKPSTTYGWPSIRISPLATSASWPRSKRQPASGARPGRVAGRG